MDPVHSRPRRIRSNRGLTQWGGLYPFWKLMRRQRGGWLSPEVMRLPGFDLRQHLARRRYKTPHGDDVPPLDDDDDVKHA